MRLDDRPVIDQITEPGPRRALRDTEAWLVDQASDEEAGLRESIRMTFEEHFADHREDLTSENQRKAFDEAADEFIGMSAAYETDRRIATIRAFAEDMEPLLW